MLNRLFPPLCVVVLVSSLDAQNCVPEIKIPKTTRVPIRNVVFQNALLLSPEDQQKVSSATTDVEVRGDLSREKLAQVPDEATERVRAAYQNRGYFKVQVEGKAVRIPTDPLGRYDIVIRVLDPGQQYRLGNLDVVKATAFPAQQLRDLFLIQRGEIFDRERIANGLEELRRLYGSQGYINFTSVPETQFDDDNAIANLTIDVNESRQFHLRSVAVLGLDAETKDRVFAELDMKPGDIYTPELWDRSLLKFHGALQNADPNAVNKRLDENGGWVDVVLDFCKPRICPAVPVVESPYATEQ